MWTWRMHMLRAGVQGLREGRASVDSLTPIDSPSLAAPKELFSLEELRGLDHRPLTLTNSPVYWPSVVLTKIVAIELGLT